MSGVIPGGFCQDGEPADREHRTAAFRAKPGRMTFKPTGLYFSVTMPADKTRGGASPSTEAAF